MKKIFILFLVISLCGCGESFESKVAKAKYLQELKDANSNIAETVTRLQAQRDFNNEMGAINARIK